MKGFLERLEEGEILVLDGATGTYLQEKGLEIGQAPETWNFSHPEVVRGMAAEYFAAGSDLVETNSFGGSRFRLRNAGLEDQVQEVNRLAANLARSAAPEGGFVLGSIGPTGELLVPLGMAKPGDLYEAFAAQAKALSEGGVDGFCVETMMAIDEAVLAVRAARESTALPVVATVTFDEGPRGFATAMGVTVPQAVESLLEAGAEVIGTNCGDGSERMVRIVREMRAVTDHPILAQPNAGIPVMMEGRTIYPETPEETANRSLDLVDAGASMVGGCCGSGPAHIAALAHALRG